MQIYEILTDETLRSTLRHGTSEFPFEYYYDEIEKYCGNCVEWHWHSELEFTLALSGPVDCLIGSERMPLHSGCGLFINSGVIHRFESRSAGVLINIIFSPEFISAAGTAVYRRFTAPVLGSGCRYFKLSPEIPDQAMALDALRAVYKAADGAGPLRELHIHTSVGSLWELFLSCAGDELFKTDRSGAAPERARLHAMLSFIHENHTLPITLDDIAASASVSKSEALRCFHRGVGSTPVRYLNDYRMSRARERLLSTAEPVSAIAWSLGFESDAYFCRMFKKSFGISPGAYRRQAF